MTFVGILGLALGLAAIFVLSARLTSTRMAIFVLAYAMHVAAAVAYFQLVKSGGGDAIGYYYDPDNLYYGDFALNTTFIIYVVQFTRSLIGGSFFDYFLIFQGLGFWGLVLLMRTFEEICAKARVRQPGWTFLLLFLPSLHYWSSAIGKDAPFFLAICTCLWAAMNHRARWPAFALGLMLMLLIRPHIAAVAGAAFAVTVLVDRTTRPLIKVPLFIVSAVGTVFAVVQTWSAFRIDLTDLDAYSSVLEGQEAMATSDAAGNSAVTGGLAVRVFSLLLRPLFIDASGAFGLIVSVENLLLLIILGIMVARMKTMAALARGIPIIRYALLSSAVLTFMLALGYYNVGLGIRQKATMILPGLLVAFVALQAVLQAQRNARSTRRLAVSSPSHR